MEIADRVHHSHELAEELYVWLEEALTAGGPNDQLGRQFAQRFPDMDPAERERLIGGLFHYLSKAIDMYAHNVYFPLHTPIEKEEGC